MSATAPEVKPKKPPRIHRFAIGVNVLIQIATVVFILAGVNYIAFKHFKRWDFSRNQKYALSGQTTQVIANLQKPLTIYVFFSPDPRLPGGDVLPDIQNLLKEYQYAGHGKVDVETIDPFRNLSRARELMGKYKFGNENVVIVDYQGRSKLVNASDMAEYDDSGEMYGQPRLLEAVRARASMQTTELFNELIDDVHKFAAESEFIDDVCLLGMDVVRVGA